MGHWKLNKRDNIYVYSKAKKEIYRINININDQSFELKKILGDINGYDFFTDYSASFYDNLFYINENNNTISIKHMN